MSHVHVPGPEAPASIGSHTVGNFYTLTGQDVWELAGYFDRPALIFRNARTGETRIGAIDSLLVSEFKPIKEGRG
jgi:hypothetical protein